MAKKIYIDKDKCIGCGTCESVCPAVFKMGDDGKAHVQEADFEANKDAIQQAIDACPVDAISWEE